MPGLAGRMSTVIKAKISKALDRAEDPAETLDYGYQKQVELLQNVKKGIADVVTSKKRLQMQSGKLEQQVVKLDTQARQALSQGREDLARAALERKTVAQTELQSLDQQVQELQNQQEAADREREEAAREDRGLPHQEGGHQGAVLRGRGAGEDLRGRQRGGRGDGRPRAGDPARRGEDRAHARSRVGGRGARGGRDLRRHHRSSAAARTTSTASSPQLGAGAQVDDELAKMKAELGSGAGEDAPALEQGEKEEPA